MKVAVAIVVLVVGVAAFIAWRPTNGPQDTRRSNCSDLHRYFAALQQSQDPDAFLIVSVTGSDSFLQFKRTRDGIEVDHPLVTDRQKEREATVRAAYRSVGLEPREASSTVGDRFLDATIPGSSAEASAVVVQLFQRIFNTPASAQLEVRCYGLSPGAS